MICYISHLLLLDISTVFFVSQRVLSSGQVCYSFTPTAAPSSSDPQIVNLPRSYYVP